MLEHEYVTRAFTFTYSVVHDDPTLSHIITSDAPGLRRLSKEYYCLYHR